jgi:hypothetical protein
VLEAGPEPRGEQDEEERPEAPRRSQRQVAERDERGAARQKPGLPPAFRQHPPRDLEARHAGRVG